MSLCNWGILIAPNAGVSLKYDKESTGANEILCTECKKFNRLGVSKSTSSEFT